MVEEDRRNHIGENVPGCGKEGLPACHPDSGLFIFHDLGKGGQIGHGDKRMKEEIQ